MAALLAATLGVSGAPVALAATWAGPAGIPGTTGQLHPLAATAPDGTDMILWQESPGSSTTLEVDAPLAPWVGFTITSGHAVGTVTYPLVERDGSVDVLWQQVGGGGAEVV